MQGCIRWRRARFACDFFLLSLVFGLLAFKTTWAAELPDDVPLTPRAIYNLKDPLEGADLVEAGYSFFYGDKFLSTTGFDLRDSHFFSEALAITAGLSFYQSSATSEVTALSAQGAFPKAHDPSFIIRA